MSRLADEVLNNFADLFDQVARLCERASDDHGMSRLQTGLYGTHTLLSLTLDVLEDKMTNVVTQDALAFLARVVRALMMQPDSAHSISELMDWLNAYLTTEATSIFLLYEEQDKLELKYAAGPVGQDVLGLKIDMGVGVVGWVAKYNENLIVPSTDLDSRFFSGVDQKTGFVTRSILCVPIVRHEQVVGALEVLNKTTGDFNDDDVILLRAVARVLADYITG